jgi:hypothetical protein
LLQRSSGQQWARGGDNHGDRRRPSLLQSIPELVACHKKRPVWASKFRMGRCPSLLGCRSAV